MKMKKTAAFLLAIAAASTMSLPVSAMQFVGGDIDGDGSITALDAAWILQYAAYTGAGGTQSIYEFVPIAETEETEKPEKEDDTFEVEGMAGKTLQEIMDAGYEYTGYMKSGSTFTGYMQGKEYPDEACKNRIEALEDKTVAELVEEYDLSIGYFKFGDGCIFLANIGDISVSFDLEHGLEALEAHSDETFFDLEEAEEIQNDKPENITLSYVTYSVQFDEASTKKILALDEIKTETIKSMAAELTVEKLTYRTNSKWF